LWREAFGRLTFDEPAQPAEEDTLFDLASLTKPIATTSVVIQLAASGALNIREPLTAFFGEWRGRDRETATVQDLLEHAGGLAAGHSGLFGTAGSVGAFGRRVLQGARGDQSIRAPFSPRLVACLTRKSSVPGSSRALGWDTMLPTSSCGTELSPAAFGHVGF